MRYLRHISLLFLLIFLLLLGCGSAKSEATTQLTAGTIVLTPAGIPSNVELAVPSSTQTPFSQLMSTETLTPSPIPLTIDPTYLNFPTNTPTPTIDPSEILLRIVSPGPMSKVISPIEFIAHISPDYTGSTIVELIGEDGEQLYQKQFKTFSNIVYYTRVIENIDYRLYGAAEMARLQISTLDNKGQLLAFNSVRLLLLAVGDNEFTAPYPVQDRILLRFPKKTDEVSGGSLSVTGEFQPMNNQPVIIELLDADGLMLGTSTLQLSPANGKYQEFATIISYAVAQRTSARLIIKQVDDRIDGLSYLYSVKLSISP